MVATVESFADQLTKIRIVPVDQVRAFLSLPMIQQTEDVLTIAKLAIREKLLTRFQAEELLQGRGRQLRVSEYVLQDVLGYGGMGLVYLANKYDDPEHPAVAIKLLSEQFKHDSGMRARFHMEAKAGLRMNHPRLVRTLELGERPDLYGSTDFMVMELFEGVTLLEGISFSRGPMKWDATCDVVCQAVEGLQFLHDNEMVHRDVKPDNILVNAAGEAKILDFGLTLLNQTSCEDEFSLSMIFGQDCLGTADYIAPEQSLNSMKVDQRADIYSLGCSLYVSLTAQRPFPKESRGDTVAAHRTHPRPRVDAVNPSVPKELVDIIERMMSIDPAKRPQSMREVGALLEPFRRRRHWAFAFDQVILRRKELKRALITKSRLNSAQVERPTRLNSSAATDAPGRLPPTDSEFPQKKDPEKKDPTKKDPV